MFICPQCQQQHRTLVAFLTCHPRQLRALTDAMYGGDLGTIKQLTRGIAPPKLRCAAAVAIEREDHPSHTH